MKTGSLVNLNFLENFTQGDIEKRNQYINLYLKTAPQLFSDLIVLCANEQWDELYIKAHSLKPQVLYMGISSLSELLIKIEETTKQRENKSELRTIVQQAFDFNNKAMNELNQLLAVTS
jgi:HPt (histidine-containing phosphotransfer) domain-containing protein